MKRLASLVAAAVLAATALGGCARTAPPAPVEIKGQRGDHRSATRTVAAGRQSTTTAGFAVVRPGDTLYGVSRTHNIPVRAMIDANGLEPPYILHPGQRLVLPRVSTHVVQAGDTIYGISRRYGIEMNGLVRANAIAPPYTIVLGQTLILPGADTPPSSSLAARGDAAPAPAAVAAPPPAVPAMRVDSAPLPAPPTATAAAPATPPPRDPPAAVATGTSETRQPARSVAAAPAPAPPPPAPSMAEQVARVAPAAAPSLPARAGQAFLWPVNGRIVSDFGPKGGGLHNDGINIAAAKGAAIRAAENGIVVYAGNELRGFGNLLLLRHADGWMTAYAHADELLVARGARVRRGQAIGRVGSTGNVASPQVHFELRRGSRAVNPLDYMTADTASSG